MIRLIETPRDVAYHDQNVTLFADRQKLVVKQQLSEGVVRATFPMTAAKLVALRESLRRIC